jgi:hypothetical protein
LSANKMDLKHLTENKTLTPPTTTIKTTAMAAEAPGDRPLGAAVPTAACIPGVGDVVGCGVGVGAPVPEGFGCWVGSGEGFLVQCFSVGILVVGFGVGVGLWVG